MKLWSDSFAQGERIPDTFCFCKPDPESHVALAENLNPALAWSDVPAGTRSFVLICHDPDVPTVGDDVNQEGRTVPHDLPRTDFFHWVLVDLHADARAIAAGSHSASITPHGKTGPDAPGGDGRHGVNDYTGWFADDPEMAGDYYGYDGPCPPWNDERLHHYVFTLYALDTDVCPVEGTFTGADVRDAMDGHVLATASCEGTYSLNPAVIEAS